MNTHTQLPGAAAPVQNETLTAALECALRGWHVFPAKIEGGAKKGCVAGKANGGERWGATTCLDTIRDYWTRFPDALLGVATGPKSGFFVVEADTPDGHGVDGIANLAALIKKHGPLPDTIEALSPSGSWHLWFKWPEGLDIRNSTSDIGEGIDVRGERGMVLAAPSIRKGFDKAYRWKNPPGPFGLADCPEWMLDKTKARQSAKPKTPARPANMPLAPPSPAYGEATLRGEIERLKAAPQGTRNAALNIAALKLGQLVPDGHLSESLIIERLTEAAAGIGLDAVETGATIKSGMSKGMTEPRGPGGDALARLGAGPSAYIPAGMTPLPASGPTIIQSEPKRESQFYSAASLYGKAVPARQWLVDGLVPQKTVTLFSGDGGTGKSLLALQLAVAVSTERAWIGNPVSKGRVIYISAEDDDDELHRRVDDILRAEGCSYSALAGLTLRSLAGEDALLAVDSQLALMKTALFEELDARAAEDTPALIVIDTLADVYPANESDRAKVRQFVGILRGLALKRKCAVMLLAHPSLTGLNSGTGTSGSTAWNNSVRSRLYLSRISDNGYEADPDARVLTTMKANYGRIGGEINVRWQAGVFVAQAWPTGFEALAVGAKCERVFLQLLDQHIETGVRVSQSGGRNYAPKLFAEHPDNEGCTQRAFRTAMSSLFARKTITISEDGPPSKRRSFIMRAAQ